ncbi:hypothetical protein SAMN05421788_10290 [Filimonas lacunae]|uniref:Uncharacterized protein n=1 Tax=Filimonas lacunae TaxID=477680 RepID=A0A173MI58_9BACT|nr:hypothetical protein [Filimonas lacunae]BAV07285.1 hypothetical protein FLA_3308 [Filimonas lacunae]SIS91998.1 hypothetical protein SAMN05421788_10290 [Filimonas lacunae]
MVALLAKRGIHIFTEMDEEGENSYSYIFTGDMLANRMVVTLEQHLLDAESEYYETVISVSFITNDDAYEFYICHDDRPVIPPLYLYRIILDTIETITDSTADSLLSNLTEISTGSASTEEYTDKEIRNNYYNGVITKIDTALKLYSEHQAENN